MIREKGEIATLSVSNEDGDYVKEPTKREKDLGLTTQ